MPLSPKHYAERATKVEQAAALLTDPVMRQEYLDVAAELRKLADVGTSLSEQTDEQIERLAERMVGSSASKL
jgi:predicted short-subunit dehydrogenase-like oxidoreductase (DUF2520 family)